MRVYTCAPDWESMLTTIYEAFGSRLGHNNIRLMLEPVEQMTLFDEYIHVEPDYEKAEKVTDSINMKISPLFYREMAITSMAYENDVLDNIYHMLILGFEFGPKVLDMLQYRDVVRNCEIRKRVEREANRFQEFIRFHQIGNVYIAHFEPKSRVAQYLGPVFQDRMPSENFIIVDDIHLDAVIHPADCNYYMQKLSSEELERMLDTESVNDSFTDLWKVFFDSIAIKERSNAKCQLNHSPLWARKHMIEFNLPGSVQS